MAHAHSIQGTVQKSAIIRNLASAITDRMGLNTQKGLIIIRFSDILYCEAMSNYCRLHLRDGSSYMASRTLKHVHACLFDNLPQLSDHLVYHMMTESMYCC